MKSVTTLLLVLAVAAAAGGWWVKFEHTPPTAELNTGGRIVGARAAWDLDVRAPGWPGLRRVEVLLTVQGALYQLLVKDYPAVSWIGSGASQDRLAVNADLTSLRVPGGSGVVQVAVETHAWQILAPRRRVVVEKEVEIDLAPPSIALLSTQHNVRLGGASVAVFRVSPDAVEAGVAVDHYFFPATHGYFADPDVAVAIFAVPQDLTASVRVFLRATDAVGNSRTVPLPCHIRDRKFPERTLPISEEFLQTTIQDLMQINNLPRQPDLLQDYLYVNRTLRAETERKVRELTRQSYPRPLWDGAFHRQSNAATMSFFADRRSYEYGGEIVDRQTHLGTDLASVQGATVEAAQNGTVVFAGNLGIYGEAVILDHGLGVFSLYGHLSAIAVHEGQKVASGEALGQSGRTGLAGGDHLHFSIMIHGVHVDPIEWWDPLWIRNHVTAKLTLSPVSPTEETAPADETKHEERPS